MYKVSRLRDTITETWYFVYLQAYEVSHRRDLALTVILRFDMYVVLPNPLENSEFEICICAICQISDSN